jgi:hypothetical protein
MTYFISNTNIATYEITKVLTLILIDCLNRLLRNWVRAFQRRVLQNISIRKTNIAVSRIVLSF